MITPPNKCLYCLSNENLFSRQEHPIPESLGNDDIILPVGFVCDKCNQYFGSKIEQIVLSKAPFGVERVVQAVKNKKGNYPIVKSKDACIVSSGYWDNIIIQSTPTQNAICRLSNDEYLYNPEWASPNEIARFLLKVGLGLLATVDTINPYEPAFHDARNCARFGTKAEVWDFAVGLYPDRSHLTKSQRVDRHGPLETRQIYQYEIGMMASGDIVFFFMYATGIFAINLSRPPALEYILGFNELNNFPIVSRWQAF